jgi:hypothetical protein
MTQLANKFDPITADSGAARLLAASFYLLQQNVPRVSLAAIEKPKAIAAT